MNNSQSSPAALSVRDLCVHYGGSPAVRGIDLDVGPGEILGIIGPSGAGKSSILAAITGTVAATGQIMYGSEDLTRTKPWHRRFGNVYQEFRLFGWLTVAENVAFPCRASGWSNGDISRRVTRAIDRVHLTDLADRRVHVLSGGQRQRVALARAMAFAPRALFLDEPFSDLDMPLRTRLRQYLIEFVAEANLPVIHVTHDRSEAFMICDRIGILFEGAMRQVGTPAELLARPIDRETAEFLGYSNYMRGIVQGVEGEFVQLMESDRTWLGKAQDRPVWTRGAQTAAVFRPVALRPATDATNRCTVTIRSAHETEHYYLLVVERGNGTTWTAHWPLAAKCPGLGETVECAIDPSDMIVFCEPE